jgi:hypothetical protein
MPQGAKRPAKKRATPKPEPPGPKPQYLKIEGDWREAVKRAIQKKKPQEGWPK